jgi:hypothetical protein
VKRKTSTTPTKIYTYGCLAPTMGEELMREILWKEHLYYNELVALERARRATLALVDSEVEPRIAVVQAARATLKEQRQQIRERLKGMRVRNRSRKVAATALREARAELKDVENQLRDMNATLKLLRDALRTDPALAARRDEINARHRELLKAARAASGLYWGNYTHVEMSVEQAARSADTAAREAYKSGKPVSPWTERPRFHRFSGEGRLRVQIQGGISCEELFSQGSTQVQVDPVPDDTYLRPRHQRRRASRTRVHIRAESTADGKPVWVELPMILHRPLPEDAWIKEAWIVRERVGPGFRHNIQFVLESQTFISAANRADGRVAVNVGWRRKDDGRIRVGYWLGDDGRYGEILVPDKVSAPSHDKAPNDLRKADDIRAKRDGAFNEMRTALKDALETSEAPLPDVCQEAIKYIDRWRSPGRLVGFMRLWRRAGVRPDHEVILAWLDEWAKRDRHLWRYESELRRARRNHRREVYRLVGLKLAREYGTIMIGEMNLTDLRRNKLPEEGALTEDTAQHRNASIAAPGELRESIKAAAKKLGREVVTEDSTLKTIVCVVDKHVNRDWDTRRSIMQTCGGACRRRMDQDHNHCANLLAGDGERSGDEETAEPARPTA